MVVIPGQISSVGVPTVTHGDRRNKNTPNYIHTEHVQGSKQENVRLFTQTRTGQINALLSL